MRILSKFIDNHGGPVARLLETRWMSALPFGAFIVAAGDIKAV